ncbi:hypothetical protein M404DRAFT_110774, partial [Pisolithus tinctorius Marx 270]
WTTEEEGMLLDFLASHLLQAGNGNFKKVTCNTAAAHMANNYPLGLDNGNKTSELFFFVLLTIIQLKKSYYAIADLKSVASGFAYDDKHSVMISLENANLWD